jgi:hypothetical protein
MSGSDPFTLLETSDAERVRESNAVELAPTWRPMRSPLPKGHRRGDRHPIIITFTASFTTKHETMA